MLKRIFIDFFLLCALSFFYSSLFPFNDAYIDVNWMGKDCGRQQKGTIKQRHDDDFVMCTTSSIAIEQRRIAHSYITDKSIGTTSVAGLFKLIFIFCGACFFLSSRCFLWFNIARLSSIDSFQCPSSVFFLFLFRFRFAALGFKFRPYWITMKSNLIFIRSDWLVQRGFLFETLLNIKYYVRQV